MWSNNYWETCSNSTGRTYTVANPEPVPPSYLTYATGGYAWEAPSNFPDVATEAVSIHEVEELRARVDELEKQIAELKKRIGGGF